MRNRICHKQYLVTSAETIKLIFFANIWNIFCYFQMSDWDRFAAEEYELLVAEEGNADGTMEEL